MHPAAHYGGVTVPDELPASETTAIYRSLQLEMQSAISAADGAYGTTGMHRRSVDAEHAGFHVQIEGGPLTDMISSAAVIAMMDLLRRATVLFDLSLDDASADELLRQARDLNEAAARLEPQ